MEGGGFEQELLVETGPVDLPGTLTVPASARGLVVFAHGSGSSRMSPRNRHVAALLNRAGLGTLLFDLLTAREEEEDAVTAALRFDIGLLAARLIGASGFLIRSGTGGGLPLGLFGSSTGAAAALVAAANRPEEIAAVVSRGGRPDLAGAALRHVRAPTLLVVGSEDREVLQLNREALGELREHGELAVVPGATHLFEEPGALDEVASLAASWFLRHLPGHEARSPVAEGPG